MGRKGYKHTEEAKRRISAALEGNKRAEREIVSYGGAHKRVRDRRGKADLFLCKCGRQAAHWAFLWRTTPKSKWRASKNNGLYGEWSIYSQDENDYEAMCGRCASWYDRDDEVRSFILSVRGE